MRLFRVVLFILMFAVGLSAAPAFSAYSGNIVSFSTSTFLAGSTTDLYVTVKSTGGAVDMAVECKNIPAGWSVDDNEIDLNNYIRKNVSANATVTFGPFKVKPSISGNTTLTWTLHTVSGWGIETWTLLETKSQPVSASTPDTTAPTLSGLSVSWSGNDFTVTATAADAQSKVKEVHVWYKNPDNLLDLGMKSIMTRTSGDTASGTYSKTITGWTATRLQYSVKAWDNANNLRDSGSQTVSKPDVVAPTVSGLEDRPAGAVNTGVGVTIYAQSVTDNVGVNSCKVFYKVPGASSYASANMTHDALDVFNGNSRQYLIPGSALTQPGTLYYYTETRDAANNLTRVPSSGDRTKTISQLDTTAPTLSGLSVSWSGNDFTVTATAADAQSKVKEVHVWYKNPDNLLNVGLEVIMTRTAGDSASGTYSKTITGWTATRLQYSIKAWDNANNLRDSGSQTVSKPDVVAPTVSGLEDRPAGAVNTGVGVTIYAQSVTDNVGVNSCKVFYKVPGASSYASANMTHDALDVFNGNSRQYLIPGSALTQPGTLYYYTETRDAANNLTRVPSSGDRTKTINQPELIITDFRPSTHGFRFDNFSGNVLLAIPVLNIDILSLGNCYGFSARSVDYFEYGVPIPQNTICSQAQTNDLISRQNDIASDLLYIGQQMAKAITSLDTMSGDFAWLKAKLQSNHPWPIFLSGPPKSYSGFGPFPVVHVVVAYKIVENYQNQPGKHAIFVYDSNEPMNDAVIAVLEPKSKKFTLNSGGYTFDWFTTLPSYTKKPVLEMLPGSFSLSVPTANATGVDPKPVLTWGPAVRATGYRIEMTGELLGKPNPAHFKDKNIGNVTSWTYDGSPTLAYGSVVWWRVVATNAAGSTDCSGSWRKFTVMPDTPPAVIITSHAISNGLIHISDHVSYVGGATNCKVAIRYDDWTNDG